METTKAPRARRVTTAVGATINSVDLGAPLDAETLRFFARRCAITA